MWQTLFTDNPLLIKHIRARLRRQQLLPMLAVVVIICGLITFAGFPRVTEATSMDDLLNARVGAFLFLFLLFLRFVPFIPISELKEMRHETRRRHA